MYYLLKWIKFSVKKKQKYWKSQGILSVRKSGNPVFSFVQNWIIWSGQVQVRISSLSKVKPRFSYLFLKLTLVKYLYFHHFYAIDNITSCTKCTRKVLPRNNRSTLKYNACPPFLRIKYFIYVY